jgi:hypothetical protein
MKLYSHIKFLLLLLSVASAQIVSADDTGLKFTGSVDAVGRFGLNPSSDAKDKFSIREIEAGVYGPVDPYFDAMLSVAAHEEAGVSFLEVHEAYLSSDRLVQHLQIKAGQYFLGIGRLNQVHRHDWPFISAPRVHSEFFGEEGVLDTGGELTWLIPTTRFWDLKLGVTNGWVHGHAHTEGEKPKHPSIAARSSTFFELSHGYGMLLGVSYLKRHTHDDQNISYIGFDWTLKGLDTKSIRWMVQTENWMRIAKNDQADGSYVFIEYRLTPRTYIGQRFDRFSRTPDKDQPKFSYTEWGLNTQFSVAPSEFSRLRLGVLMERLESDLASEQSLDKKDRLSLETQFVYIIGAHPSHGF